MSRRYKTSLSRTLFKMPHCIQGIPAENFPSGLRTSVLPLSEFGRCQGLHLHHFVRGKQEVVGSFQSGKSALLAQNLMVSGFMDMLNLTSVQMFWCVPYRSDESSGEGIHVFVFSVRRGVIEDRDTSPVSSCCDGGLCNNQLPRSGWLKPGAKRMGLGRVAILRCR